MSKYINGALWFFVFITGMAVGGYIEQGIDRCPEEEPVDCTYEKYDECVRCRDKESKNWQRVMYTCHKALEKKVVYRDSVCGPYEWTCEEAVENAALNEKAYHHCEYDGHFPGVTMLDLWLDEYRERKERD